jgi:hypothetical protein
MGEYAVHDTTVRLRIFVPTLMREEMERIGRDSPDGVTGVVVDAWRAVASRLASLLPPKPEQLGDYNPLPIASRFRGGQKEEFVLRPSHPIAEEITAEAVRLDQSVSWCVQVAWSLAHPDGA